LECRACPGVWSRRPRSERQGKLGRLGRGLAYLDVPCIPVSRLETNPRIEVERPENGVETPDFESKRAENGVGIGPKRGLMGHSGRRGRTLPNSPRARIPRVVPKSYAKGGMHPTILFMVSRAGEPGGFVWPAAFAGL
jgi:hypothetical protein